MLVVCHGRKSLSKPSLFLSVIFVSDIFVSSSKVQDEKFFQVNVTKICFHLQKEHYPISSGFDTSSKKIKANAYFCELNVEELTSKPLFFVPS